MLDPLFLSFQDALAGRYSIDRELGRGGMGVVYLAHEVHLDRLVAIKLLPPDKAADPALRARFLGEARMAAKLSHPHIVPIHSVDETAGFVFYVMAFVDGETLTQRVRTRGPLPASEGTRVLREVAWALAHAHTQGLVHRDVKPDNILLENGTGRALVADFGITLLADPGPGHLRHAGFMVGAGRRGVSIRAATCRWAQPPSTPSRGGSVRGRTATEVWPPRHGTGTPAFVVGAGRAAQGGGVDRSLPRQDPQRRPASADAW